LRYATLLFWPTRLSAFHVFHASSSLKDGHVLGGIAVVVAFGVVAVLAVVKKLPVIAFCILWMGLTLLPVLNARWMAANVFTERYLYLPSVGFCWLMGWCAVRVWKASASWSAAKGPFRVASLLMLGAIVAASCFAIIERNKVWHDDLSLYTQTLRT